jgi:hypothetical protein
MPLILLLDREDGGHTVGRNVAIRHGTTSWNAWITGLISSNQITDRIQISTQNKGNANKWTQSCLICACAQQHFACYAVCTVQSYVHRWARACGNFEYGGLYRQHFETNRYSFLYATLRTVNKQHTSRQDAIIKIRLYLATCFGRKRLSSSQLRMCGVYLLYINYWIYRKCNLTVDSTINVNRHRKS